MPKIDETIINFAVYEDATEYIGMTEATLPEITALTQEISGAGIAGNVESVIIGHMSAMTLTLNFRVVTNDAIKLNQPKLHNIDLRAAQQVYDTSTGIVSTVPVKHVMKIRPKKYAPGKLAPSSPADASGEYAVSYYALYVDGTKKVEVDPLNFIYLVDGTDYLADVRTALGKEA